MKVEKIKRRNSFISNGKYENRQNCEYCGISNGQAIPKFANCWNFDSFPYSKNSENLLFFHIQKTLKICYFSNLENS